MIRARTQPLLGEVPFPEVDEIGYETVLSNGLPLKMLPKRGYSKKFAILATNYGSIDTDFEDRLTGKRTVHPAGVAHFLEHCLFAQEEGDICDEFSKYGASANAGTGFSSTSYLFSCSNHFERSLNLLLKFVFTPFFTDEVVQKERGIIGQEIGMYADSAEWRLFMSLLEGLYHRHPIRTDIAGSVSSISEISTDTLASCHATFYHPENMVLLLVGDFDPHKILKRVEQSVSKLAKKRETAPLRDPIQRYVPREPRSVFQRETVLRLPVAHPKVLLGFKDSDHALPPQKIIKKDTATSLLLDIVIGRSSDLYSELYDQGLIDDSFSASYNADRSFGFTAIGGDSRDPAGLVKALFAGFRRIKRRGIDAKDFRRIRDKAYGRFYQSFNSIEGIAYTLMHHHFRDVDIAEQLRILKRLRKEDVEARAAEHLLSKHCAITYLYPNGRS